MPKISPLSLVRNGERDAASPTPDDLRSELLRAFRSTVQLVEDRARAEGELSFRELERELRDAVFGLGRAFIVLFLALREQHVIVPHRAGRFEWFGRTFRPAPPIARNLTTLFGVVRYWRTYMREVADRKRHGWISRWASRASASAGTCSRRRPAWRRSCRSRRRARSWASSCRTRLPRR